jgi:hypothetical protein
LIFPLSRIVRAARPDRQAADAGPPPGHAREAPAIEQSLA